MKLETERLFLYPVSDDEIRAIIEKEKDPEMIKAYSEMLEGCISHPESRIWYAVWYMELKEKPGTVVGDFCFKGIDKDGMTEIGYGLYDTFCGQGYMTECISYISGWAMKQQGVLRVEAEAEETNTASIKVLMRSGYVPTGTLGEEGPRFVYSIT